MVTKEKETYLTANEACQRLGVSRKTLDRYVERGLLTKYRRGINRVVFKESEVNRVLVRPIESEEE